MLRYGLSFAGPHRTALFGDGAVGAAVLLDRIGIQPRAVAFLAMVVRRGGSAATAVGGVDGDEEAARWLEAVAELLSLRRVHGSRVVGE